jgi:chemotaxis protein methyltransferase CheR
MQMSTGSVNDYRYLRQVVLGHSRNVLDPSCDYLFDARLSRLLRNHGMSRVDELVRALRLHKDAVLERAVAEAMTINETSFFRDHWPFEYLRTDLLPEMIERRRAVRTLRFLSAGCSTGQEALSLAMVLRECSPQIAHWNIRIDGTDICTEAVARARDARYHRVEMNRGLPARMLVRYFTHDGEHWEAKREIRTMCHFQQANLCATPLPFRDCFDVIFLRNVMLYFSPETRKTVLEEMRRLLASEGVLFLGSSEQPVDGALWTTVLAGGTCFYRPKRNERGQGLKLRDYRNS